MHDNSIALIADDCFPLTKRLTDEEEFRYNNTAYDTTKILNKMDDLARKLERMESKMDSRFGAYTLVNGIWVK